MDHLIGMAWTSDAVYVENDILQGRRNVISHGDSKPFGLDGLYTF